MSLLSAIAQRLGYVRRGEVEAALKAAASRLGQARYVETGGTGVHHPGKTENDLNYSWMHPWLFANYAHIAMSSMGVPLRVQRMVPTQETKSAGRYITRPTARHCQVQYCKHPAAERRDFLLTKGLQAEDVDDGHPLRVLLDYINERDTWRTLIYQTLFDLEAAGNAYWELRGGKGGAPPGALGRIRPDRMFVVPDEEELVKGYIYRVNGKEVRFEPEEVLHFKYPHPMNDYYGLAKGEVLEKPLKTDWNRLEYAEALFENGLRIGKIIVPKEGSTINDDEMQRLIDVLNGKHRGAKKAGGVAGLQDVDIHDANMTPKDAEYLGMADRHDIEIGAVTGVPTPLFKAKDVNRSNLEGAQLQFWSDAMTPRLSFVSDYLNEFLCPRFGEDLVADFDLSGVKVLGEESSAVVEREDKLFAAGVTSIDEFREAAGYDALPDDAGQRYKRRPTEKLVTLEEDLEPEPEPPPMLVPPQFPPAPEDQEQEPQEPPPPPPPGKSGQKAMRPRVAYGSERHKALIGAHEDRRRPHEARLEGKVREWAGALEVPIQGALEEGKSLKATDPVPEAILFDVDVAGELLWEVVSDGSIEAAIEEGGHLLGEVGLEGLTFEPENPLVLEHIAAKKLKVKTVAKTLHEDLKKLITQKVRTGSPVADLQRAIRGRFDHLQKYQAEAIAQTEIGGAMNAGAEAAIVQAEMGKEWIATLDNVARDTHISAMMEGPIAAGETFASNGLMRPGDANGSAAEVVRCRCALAPAALEEAGAEEEE